MKSSLTPSLSLSQLDSFTSNQLAVSGLLHNMYISLALTQPDLMFCSFDEVTRYC